ncbi:MAG: DUF3795 domain-containing protein [Methanomicrobiales archaeon]|nr:DUF3795 domain-containing protein [Methanomicrobiales archaeon]
MSGLIPTVCGMYCDECDHYEQDCQGCDESEGTIFWNEYVDIECCPVYDCCVNKKHLVHCGQCDEMPCERYFRFRDPGVTEEEAKQVLEKQKACLARRVQEEKKL